MTGEHGTLEAFGAFVMIWGTIFFGVWALPGMDTIKILVDVISTIGVFISGLSYFIHKKIIHVPHIKNFSTQISFFDVHSYCFYLELCFTWLFLHGKLLQLMV